MTQSMALGVTHKKARFCDTARRVPRMRSKPSIAHKEWPTTSSIRMRSPLRNAKRRKGERICLICGAAYQAHGKNRYCSKACRREGRRLSLVKSEARRKERRMQDKAKKDPRGGARPGAGRKKGGENSTREDAINRSVTLAAAEWEELGKDAKRYGISANKLAARIIRAHLAARPSPDTE